VHHQVQLCVELGYLINFLLRVALNHDHPNLCLSSSWDYSCEPPCMTKINIFKCPYYSSNIQIHWNPKENINDIIHRNRRKILKFLWELKRPEYSKQFWGKKWQY
jgi:hypothetical protein